MKPKLNSPAVPATKTLAPCAGRFVPALSLEKSARQAAVARLPVRVPVVPQNRAYLKALREAELALWETPSANLPVPGRNQRVAERLPTPDRDAREGWFYAVLAGLCITLLGYELWTAFQAAGNWYNFVRYVRELLA